MSQAYAYTDGERYWVPIAVSWGNKPIPRDGWWFRSGSTRWYEDKWIRYEDLQPLTKDEYEAKVTP
jgi:hypothetical protein